MTGRAAGYCASIAVPDYMPPAAGRGLGYGRGRGFGCGFGAGFRGGRWAVPNTAAPAPVTYAPPLPNAQQELGMLKAQAQSIGTALENVNARISELETGADDA